MRFWGISIFAAVIASAASVASGPASATQITYDSYGVVDNTNVYIDYPAGGVNGTYGSGQIDFYDQGNLVAAAWCIDASHDLYGSGVFNVIAAVDNGGTSNIDNGGGTGTLLSWQTLGELGALADYGDQNINTPNLSPAIQLAIWDVEYGNAITTTSSSSAVQALAATLVFDAEHGALGSDTDVEWLMYCNEGKTACNQGQLVVLGAGNSKNDGTPLDSIPVPEPSSLAVLGAALLTLAGFGALRRRRNRNPAG